MFSRVACGLVMSLWALGLADDSRGAEGATLAVKSEGLPSVLFLVDAPSASNIAATRELVGTVLQGIPERANVGLRLCNYPGKGSVPRGGRQAIGDRLVAPMGPQAVRRADINRWLRWANDCIDLPKATPAPLAEQLFVAANDFPADGGPRFLVLISAGSEGEERWLRSVQTKYASSGIRVIVFSGQLGSRAKLVEILAQGSFARNAFDIVSALDIPQPKEFEVLPAGVNPLAGIADIVQGKLPANIKKEDVELLKKKLKSGGADPRPAPKRRVLARGRTDGPRVDVAPGTYMVRVAGSAVPHEIEVVSGSNVTLLLDKDNRLRRRASGRNLLKDMNCDFEKDDLAAEFQPTSKVTSWQVLNGPLQLAKAELFENSAGGRACLELKGAGGIGQAFASQPGKEYILTFDVAVDPRQKPGAVQMLLAAIADPRGEGRYKQFLASNALGKRWKTVAWRFQAQSPATRLQFLSLADGEGPAIDNISVVPVE